MAKLILRSFCAGIVSIALAGFVGAFIALSLAFFNSSAASPAGDQEVGWDLIGLARSHLVPVIVAPLVFFTIGFLFGFLHFSKRQGRRGSPG